MNDERLVYAFMERHFLSRHGSRREHSSVPDDPEHTAWPDGLGDCLFCSVAAASTNLCRCFVGYLLVEGKFVASAPGENGHGEQHAQQGACEHTLFRQALFRFT